MLSASLERRLERRLARRLERRLERLSRRWPPGLKTDFVRYRTSREGSGGGEAVARPFGRHYSLRLPVWLLHHRSLCHPTPKPPPAPGFLDDVVWAQYCVFLTVRVGDDLFDRQTDLASLATAADSLRTEASRALAEHFSAGSLSVVFLRQAWRETATAICEVDRLQRRPEGMSCDDLTRYAGVGEIFKLAATAVLERLGREGEREPVGAFCDHLAMAGQIVDDLIDVFEDLDDGRRNFAASRLLELGRCPRSGREGQREVIRESLINGRGPQGLFDLTREQLRLAGRAIAPLSLAPASAFLARRGEELDRCEAGLYRQRAAPSRHSLIR